MDAFLGTISAFGFNYAPYQWAVCGGQLLSISSNTALFSLLGVNYGGDGRTTFGLPNLISRAAVGMGADTPSHSYNQGATGGVENVQIGANNLPQHSHNVGFSLNANNTSSGTSSASGHFPGNSDPDGSVGTLAYTGTPTTNAFMAGVPTITLGPAGGAGASVGVRMPMLAINYCIAQYGVFPTRS